MKIKIYKDDFENMAMIEKIKTLPYKDAPRKETAYRLILCSLYDDNKPYFLSLYESLKAATEKLKEFSCNTWKEIEG